jgi:hypothetical protein
MSDLQAGLTRHGSRDAQRWRAWIRGYLAALMLTLQSVAAQPNGHVPSRPAIVRLSSRQPGFDPREVVDARIVLTVPIGLAGGLDRDPFGLN